MCIKHTRSCVFGVIISRVYVWLCALRGVISAATRAPAGVYRRCLEGGVNHEQYLQKGQLYHNGRTTDAKQRPHPQICARLLPPLRPHVRLRRHVRWRSSEAAGEWTRATGPGA